MDCLGRDSGGKGNSDPGADPLLDHTGWWIILIFISASSVALSLYRDRLITAFAPHKEDIVNFPASFVYPVLLLIAISFPPLFGQEIVILIVGVIWGLWYGFGEHLCVWCSERELTRDG